MLDSDEVSAKVYLIPGIKDKMYGILDKDGVSDPDGNIKAGNTENHNLYIYL